MKPRARERPSAEGARGARRHAPRPPSRHKRDRPPQGRSGTGTKGSGKRAPRPSNQHRAHPKGDRDHTIASKSPIANLTANSLEGIERRGDAHTRTGDRPKHQHTRSHRHRANTIKAKQRSKTNHNTKLYNYSTKIQKKSELCKEKSNYMSRKRAQTSRKNAQTSIKNGRKNAPPSTTRSQKNHEKHRRGGTGGAAARPPRRKTPRSDQNATGHRPAAAADRTRKTQRKIISKAALMWRALARPAPPAAHGWRRWPY